MKWFKNILSFPTHGHSSSVAAEVKENFIPFDSFCNSTLISIIRSLI